jgi:hypothetical protein
MNEEFRSVDFTELSDEELLKLIGDDCIGDDETICELYMKARKSSDRELHSLISSCKWWVLAMGITFIKFDDDFLPCGFFDDVPSELESMYDKFSTQEIDHLISSWRIKGFDELDYLRERYGADFVKIIEEDPIFEFYQKFVEWFNTKIEKLNSDTYDSKKK